MREISGWVYKDGAAYRHYIGTDGDQPENRVALIEKTPRVRIRDANLRVQRGRYEDGGEYINYSWSEFLDWCEGYKGDGPNDKDSLDWCDNMLKALGYTV